MLKQTLRTHLEKKHSQQDLRQWFDPLNLERGDAENCLSVHFPHKLFGRWFMSAHRDNLESCLKEYLGESLQVRYTADNGQVFTLPPPPAGKAKTRETAAPLSQIYAFEHFLPGSKNSFPVEIIKRIASGAEELGKFNPLVLWGSSSCGKTHLLRALANELITLNKATVFYCTPDELKAHYEVAKNQRRARQRILAYSVLVVDDLQKIYSMPSSQDELTLLIDALLDAGKQMVFAGLDKPGEADALNPSLRTRLESGLCLAIKEPDLAVRTQYIMDKCLLNKLSLRKEQVLALAARFEGIRQLDGILKRLAAYTSLSGRDLLDSDFESMLRHAGGKALPEVTSSLIINLTAAHLEISPAEILGGKRRHDIVAARQIAMYLCRELLNSSYPELGKIFGGKDHSTIMYSVKKVEENLKLNPDMHKTVKELKAKCLEIEA